MTIEVGPNLAEKNVKDKTDVVEWSHLNSAPCELEYRPPSGEAMSAECPDIWFNLTYGSFSHECNNTFDYGNGTFNCTWTTTEQLNEDAPFGWYNVTVGAGGLGMPHPLAIS